MSDRKNTAIPFSTIRKCYEWQAHLERISDFLRAGLWEETEFGIVFNDFEETEKNFPRIHHFRNSSMEKEYK